jgi:hypothetical protein
LGKKTRKNFGRRSLSKNKADGLAGDDDGGTGAVHLLNKIKRKALPESVEGIRRHVQKALDFIISCISAEDEEGQFYQV